MGESTEERVGLGAERPKGGDGESDEAETRGGVTTWAAGGGGEVNAGPVSLVAAMGGEAGGVGVVSVNPSRSSWVKHLDINQGVSARAVQVSKDKVRLTAQHGELPHEVSHLAATLALCDNSRRAKGVLADIDQLIAGGVMHSRVKAEAMGATNEVTAGEGDGGVATSTGTHAAVHAA